MSNPAQSNRDAAVAGFIFVFGIACLFVFRVRPKGRRRGPLLFAALIGCLAAYLLPQFFPTQTAVVLQPGTVTIERDGGRSVVIRADDIATMTVAVPRSDTVLLLTTKAGEEFFIYTSDDRRPQVAEAIARHAGLQRSGSQQRWSRPSP